jgi:serine protease inhibitor
LKNICLILIAVGCIIPCNKTAVKDIHQNISLPANSDKIVNASNDFTFSFLDATLQTDTSVNNKLISPFSIFQSLGMAYNGAANATADSIANALGVVNIDINDFNNSCKTLMKQLPHTDNQVAFSVANSIWYAQGNLHPLAYFLNVMNTDFDGAIHPLDFHLQDAVNTINNWVSANTGGKIQKIIQQINPGDLMYLLNAAYFKGNWKHNFDSSLTHNDTFFLQNGARVIVAFMKQKQDIACMLNDSLQMAELPYGSSNFCMDIILPAKNISVLRLAASLNAASFDNLISQLHISNEQLALPKWQTTYNIEDMQLELTKLGMGIAFSNRADFSNMYNAPATITKAIHKTYIKVDEQGTEAAAVTGTGISITAIRVQASINFNHPFLYFIREKSNGTILFVGILNNPLQTSGD